MENRQNFTQNRRFVLPGRESWGGMLSCLPWVAFQFLKKYENPLHTRQDRTVILGGISPFFHQFSANGTEVPHPPFFRPQVYGFHQCSAHFPPNLLLIFRRSCLAGHWELAGFGKMYGEIMMYAACRTAAASFLCSLLSEAFLTFG